ncbi:hypothetical protein [Streptomyces sp. NPDC056949]|uniref:hypothetical protein n=1 Tax=Streptomyces sp. NPDC056949 TaxID=3345976 RepID=UPI00363DB07B
MTAPSAPAPADVPPVEPRTESEDADGTEEGTQEARAAQRELFSYAPAFILDRTCFGGSPVPTARHGVSGGGAAGDVFLGGRTENHDYNGAAAGATHVSGEIPRGDLDALAAVLVDGPAFASAPARLREERVLVLAAAHAGGRYAAAQGKKLREPGGLAKLLPSHPDNDTRLRALEPCLQPIR